MNGAAAGIVWLSAAYFSIKFITAIFTGFEERKRKAKRNSFKLYVETGTKDKAFNTLSRHAVKAAEWHRLLHIAERARNNKTFTALSECPKCYNVDIHYVSTVKFRRRKCVRQCKQCDFNWRQK
jgi:hypothetical protein